MHWIESLPSAIRGTLISFLFVAMLAQAVATPFVAYAEEGVSQEEEEVQEGAGNDTETGSQTDQESQDDETLDDEQTQEEVGGAEDDTQSNEEEEGTDEEQTQEQEEAVDEKLAETLDEAATDTDQQESLQEQALAQASSQSDAAVLITGDATALAAIFNLVNTTFVNSQGNFIALSNLEELVGSIDVRAPNDDSSGPNVCEESDCRMLVLTENEAEVLNDVQVVATSGNNTAHGGRDVLIQTGNAYALASVFTFANATFVDSNYLVLSLNHAGDWEGDLILPSEGALAPDEEGGSVNVETENEAEVDNEVHSDANSGENTAEGESTSIQTGSARALSWVFNQINTNLVNTSFVHLAFNVAGNHNGNVFSLPFWLNYTPNEHGFVLWGTPPNSDRTGGVESWTIDTTNNVLIDNSVSANANTGDNEASSEDGDVSIQTGTAYAIASAGNIANINVFGSNWLFGMFNIAGDWNGDISFGRPDIWVGQRAETPRSPVQAGDIFTNRITVRNDGDATATQTTLSIEIDSNVEINEISHGGVQQAETLSWSFGTLAPGQIIEVFYEASVENALSFGTSYIQSEALATALETDEAESNNRDTLKIEAYRRAPLVIVELEEPQEEEEVVQERPRLIVEKTNDADGPLAPGEEVLFTIRVRNDGNGPATNTRLRDTLMSETGLLISDEVIQLGTVAPGEEVVVAYTLTFTDAIGGTFSNRAFVFESTGTSSSNDISSVQVELPQPLPQELEEEPEVFLPLQNENTTGLQNASVQTVSSGATDQNEEENQEEEEEIAIATSTDRSNLQASLLSAFGDSLWEWRWWLLVLTVILLAPLFAPALRRRS